jgi:hypothetical protein
MMSLLVGDVLVGVRKSMKKIFLYYYGYAKSLTLQLEAEIVVQYSTVVLYHSTVLYCTVLCVLLVRYCTEEKT